MSAFASLSLTNAAAVAVVFNPASIDSSGVARWLTSDAIYDSKKAATMLVTYPKNGGQVCRIKQKIVIPIMDAVDASKKVSEAYVNIEAVIPKNASETTRMDLRKFADSFLMHAVATAAYQNLEGIY